MVHYRCAARLLSVSAARSLAVTIQMSSERLLSYLGDAPCGSVGADRQVANSERRGGQESAELHANVATVLIKRDASRPPSDGLTDAAAP